MKKMPYAIIFIIIVALLVFAGCKMFSNEPSDNDSTDGSISQSEEFSSDDISDNVSDTEASSTGDESSSSEEPSQSTSGEEQPSSEQPSSSAPTTDAPTEPTASQPQESTTAEPQPGANEYDVLTSGKFYLDGTMYAAGEANPITLAVGDDLVYMQTTMDGATMGFLISSGNTYLLNPAEKTYCEFGSILSGLLSQAGMMSQEEIMEMINDMGFSTMDPLSAADQTSSATLNGKACTVYVFNKSDGTKTRVFMDGNKLLGFEIVGTNDVVDSATYINNISADIPTLPPKDYTKQNILTFMTSMESILGD